MNVLSAVFLLLTLAIYCEANHSKAQLAFLHAHFTSCAEDLGISNLQDLENHIVAGDELRNPDDFKRLVQCVLVRARFADCQMNFFMDNYVNFYRDGHDVTNMTAVVRSCLAGQEGMTPLDRVLPFYKCIFHSKGFKP